MDWCSGRGKYSSSGAPVDLELAVAGGDRDARDRALALAGRQVAGVARPSPQACGRPPPAAPPAPRRWPRPRSRAFSSASASSRAFSSALSSRSGSSAIGSSSAPGGRSAASPFFASSAFRGGGLLGARLGCRLGARPRLPLGSVLLGLGLRPACCPRPGPRRSGRSSSASGSSSSRAGRRPASARRPSVLDLQRLRLLCLVRVLGSRVDLQLRELLAGEAVAGQHSLDRLADHLFGAPLEHLPQRPRLDPARDSRCGASSASGPACRR